MKYLVYEKDGIFYIPPNNGPRPKSIMIYKKKYYRFMDFIYIPKELEKLNSNQVRTVNNIRSNFSNYKNLYGINKIVRGKILSLIKKMRVKNLLEIGPGDNPLINDDPKIAIKYYCGDLNKKFVGINNKRNIYCFYFGRKSRIPLNNNSVNLIVSLFVFQFKITTHQINEFNRVLKKRGLILANIYKRTNKSKNYLMDKFKKAGFKILIFPDTKKLCDSHEYWCLFKGTQSRLASQYKKNFENE